MEGVKTTKAVVLRPCSLNTAATAGRSEHADRLPRRVQPGDIQLASMGTQVLLNLFLGGFNGNHRAASWAGLHQSARAQTSFAASLNDNTPATQAAVSSQWNAPSTGQESPGFPARKTSTAKSAGWV